ncbi:Atpase synthesis protein [Pleurostoma richardsiae]|uniref:ATPase synthesis protein 25 n=1 Tax=Pleurostoma richardsiae TaxID=41990 RepID=A0AA38RIA1_9PEZI|nr:Atpase synthesis protein [Pleurostoma richardsiae]
MLFGTARSERHLHVSAGNLVRWLRTKGIHANADGLLGPNELKIRLRRKARKAKLLGNSGLTPSEDDGISTRWICVNLGTIGWTSAEAELQSDDGRFSGFGAPRTGTTIVVQLFTDAKRKELDLETLWDRILQRQARADSGNAGPDIQKPSSPLQVPGPRTTHPFSRPGQQRVLSTYAPRRAGLSDFTDRTDQVIQTPLRKPGLRIVDDVLALSPSGKFGALEKLRTHFVQLPEPLAHEALRFRDAPSGFMQAWNKVVSSLPSDRTWRFRLWLYSTGRKMGHLDYNLSGLRGLVREMQLSCIQPGQDHYLVLLQAIYTEPGGSDDLLKAQSELAVELLDTMYERGDAVITADILVTVMESLARSGVSGPEMERLQSVLDKLIVQAKLPYLGETLLMRLMDAYAFQGNWDRFWEVWRIPPRFQMARSPVMYTYVYRRLADTGHQSRCVHAVRSCFWEMLAEDPPVVPQDELLEALRACIKVADPEAISLDWRLLNTWDMDKEDKGKLRRREFVKLAKALRKMERRRGYAEGTA